MTCKTILRHHSEYLICLTYRKANDLAHRVTRMFESFLSSYYNWVETPTIVYGLLNSYCSFLSLFIKLLLFIIIIFLCMSKC